MEERESAKGLRDMSFRDATMNISLETKLNEKSISLRKLGRRGILSTWQWCQILCKNHITAFKKEKTENYEGAKYPLSHDCNPIKTEQPSRTIGAEKNHLWGMAELFSFTDLWETTITQAQESVNKNKKWRYSVTMYRNEWLKRKD